MLDSVCPIDGDCGRLCGAACCTAGDTDGEELGIYLYPGEEKLGLGAVWEYRSKRFIYLEIIDR